MAKRLSPEEKLEIAKGLGAPERPLQQIVDWKDDPQNPPEVVKDAVRKLRSPGMTAARKKAAERLQQTDN